MSAYQIGPGPRCYVVDGELVSLLLFTVISTAPEVVVQAPLLTVTFLPSQFSLPQKINLIALFFLRNFSYLFELVLADCRKSTLLVPLATLRHAFI